MCLAVYDAGLETEALLAAIPWAEREEMTDGNGQIRMDTWKLLHSNRYGDLKQYSMAGLRAAVDKPLPETAEADAGASLICPHCGSPECRYAFYLGHAGFRT